MATPQLDTLEIIALHVIAGNLATAVYSDNLNERLSRITLNRTRSQTWWVRSAEFNGAQVYAEMLDLGYPEISETERQKVTRKLGEFWWVHNTPQVQLTHHKPYSEKKYTGLQGVEVFEALTLYATGNHSQAELAERFGVSQGSMRKLVTGRSHPKQYERFQKKLLANEIVSPANVETALDIRATLAETPDYATALRLAEKYSCSIFKVLAVAAGRKYRSAPGETISRDLLQPIYETVQAHEY